MLGHEITREKFIETLENTKILDIGLAEKVTYYKKDHTGIDGVFYSRLTTNNRFEIFSPLED